MAQRHLPRPARRARARRARPHLAHSERRKSQLRRHPDRGQAARARTDPGERIHGAGHLLARIAAGHYSTRDYSADRPARGVSICSSCIFPSIAPTSPARDRRRRTARPSRPRSRRRAPTWFGPDAAIFDFLRDALTLDLIAPGRAGHSIARVRRFAFKVQQFTGPMMAKSLEDTAFYRYHRLLALNEVGGSPAARALPVESFHDLMRARAKEFPHGLTATATHDTKRGEDARTRLLALSELADDWEQAVEQLATTQRTARSPPATACASPPRARIHAVSGAARRLAARRH